MQERNPAPAISNFSSMTALLEHAFSRTMREPRRQKQRSRCTTRSRENGSWPLTLLLQWWDTDNLLWMNLWALRPRARNLDPMQRLLLRTNGIQQWIGLRYRPQMLKARGHFFANLWMLPWNEPNWSGRVRFLRRSEKAKNHR